MLLNDQDADGENAFHIVIQGAHKNLDLFSKMVGHDTPTPSLNVKNHGQETIILPFAS